MDHRSALLNSFAHQIPSHHEVLVVGGGIAGAGVFRDLSLHGISTLLIDKKDFTSQTSQSSSKMLHGGIRYLENLDFALVWEALHEKNLWLKLAPHLSYPEEFYLPVYKDGLRPLWMIRLGLFLYDALSSFNNLPSSQANATQTLKQIPLLKERGLTGSGIYSDAVMDDAKITLECIYDGLLQRKSYACNHTSLERIEKYQDGYKAVIKDQITQCEREITCNKVVFTTGPFTDKLLSELKLFDWTPKLKLSRGSHLWFDNDMLKLKKPMVLTPKDGRVIFVIPQRDKTLVGTTEVKGRADFDQSPSDEEVDYLFKNLKEFFPKAIIDKKYLLGQFAGVRPLVMEDGENSLGKVARNHKVYQPQENAFVLMGGKYTTFRVMAQDVVEPLLHQMRRPYQNHLSTLPLRKPSQVVPWTEFTLSPQLIEQIILEEFPKTKEDFIHRRLGSREEDLSAELITQIESSLEKNLKAVTQA